VRDGAATGTARGAGIADERGTSGPRRGRADVHIHTLASDGVDDVLAVLDRAAAMGLDVVAITDHDRVDAALAARAIARGRGMALDVIVGEEISTRSGHLLALGIAERIPPLRPLEESVARVHDQGGIAIAAHPLTPYLLPMCIGEKAIRRLAAAPDPRHRLDAIEAFNPTTFGRARHGAVVRLARELGLPETGASDAHEVAAIGMGATIFPGRTADDLRAAIAAGETRWVGTFHGSASQLPTFGRQLRKYGRAWRDGLVGIATGGTTGRDLGYPGGRLRPARLDLEAALATSDDRDAPPGDGGAGWEDGAAG
jgi:predicted metal-dependent phosphoesterase TrpH